MNFFDLKFSSDISHGENFYNFVNDHWIKTNEIPSDYQRWGTFQEIEKKTNEEIKKLLEDEITSNPNYQKVILIYNQLNNQELRDSQNNFNIVLSYVNKIKEQTNVSDLFGLMVELDIKIGLNLPLNFIVDSDFSNSIRNILYLTSGGLGLPDKDYYTLEKKKYQREKYIDFIEMYGKLFTVELNSIDIFKLEKKLAEKTLSKIKKRNSKLTNNKVTLNDFLNKYPNLRFVCKFFEFANKKPGIINLSDTEFVVFLNNFINTIGLETWKQYFIFHLILEFNYCLSQQIETEYWKFYSNTLKGSEKMKPQWIRSIENLNHIIGELTGLYYAEKYFKSDSKNLAMEIVNLIKEELRDYLKSNDWMESKTKIKALEKLELMNVKIGYPDFIGKNYRELFVNTTNYPVANIILVKTFNNKYTLDELYNNVNKKKWSMNAHAINAYYSPSLNEIVFPAGILQKPFFSIDQDISLNFGGFGMIIGHEITHGFDDEGCKYNGYGNLENWWTPSDLAKYEKIKSLVVSQYNQYEIDGNKVNGELTIGENIADIGGLLLSFRAFKKYNQCHRLKVKINYDNLLSPEHMFFINFANIWKTKERPEEIKAKVLLDVHSPPIFRVNGSLRNMDDFYGVFNIKPTDKLYLKPEERVRIWG